MLLLRLLRGLVKGLKAGKFAFGMVYARVTTLFSKDLGFWGWWVLTGILVLNHREAVTLLVTKQQIWPLFMAYGESLGTSVQTALAGLRKVPGTTGWTRLQMAFKTISALAHVLWYFKASYIVSTWMDPDVSPALVLTFITGFYAALVANATGWVPSAEMFEALKNLPEIFRLEALNPLFDQGNATGFLNGTESGEVAGNLSSR